MPTVKGTWLVAVSSLLAAACSSSPVTQPPLAPCSAASGGQVTLLVGEYGAVDPTQTAGCAVFPAAPSAAAVEYLLVPQGASGVPDDSSSFLLRGAAVAAAPPFIAGPAGAPPALPVQLQFDLNLRGAERQLAAHFGRPLRGPPRRTAPGLAPPVVGTSRSFKVCGDLNCKTHPSVSATAKKVSTHVAIYVDSAALQNGDTLSPADLDALAAVFDTLLYPADTLAFGRETDIDNNGVVLVLMTGKVNSLVAKPCTNGFVAGFFYGGDLVPNFSGGNDAEIFYSIVPDPNGTLSCAHSATGVKHTVPSTFIHEFQHMISWGHHVVNGDGVPEVLWLNEGLSHYAEELGSRLYVPGDSTTFCYFIAGDLYNSGQYFAKPESSFLVDTTGIGGLANRGAYWLFVRYLVDQFSADTAILSNDAFTRTLEDPARTGATNVAHAAGTPFATLVGRWALANYVSDLPAFTAPAELRYAKWRFRTDYAAVANRCAVNAGVSGIPTTYPLTPGSSAGSAVNLTGMLRSGSGPYTTAQQPASAPGFTLLFSTGTGTALRSSLVPRLNVIRLQ